MKMRKTTFLTMLILAITTTYGQQGIWKPFKLLVIQPDTAIIDQSLYSGRDSIVSKHIHQYYESVNLLEKLINCVNCPSDSGEIEKMKKEFLQLKSYESEVKNFKYYHILSTYSIAIYKFYFNEYKPFSTIIEIPNQKTDSASLKTLADTSKSDYIVFYSNIHSGTQNGTPILKVTTTLYSRKDNKIILKKETEGDITSKGEMWTCSENLTCLFINGVKSSTDEVSNILTRRQKRKK